MVKEGFKLVTNEEGEDSTECEECEQFAWGECETEEDYNEIEHLTGCKYRRYRK